MWGKVRVCPPFWNQPRFCHKTHFWYLLQRKETIPIKSIYARYRVLNLTLSIFTSYFPTITAIIIMLYKIPIQKKNGAHYVIKFRSKYESPHFHGQIWRVYYNLQKNLFFSKYSIYITEACRKNFLRKSTHT